MSEGREIMAQLQIGDAARLLGVTTKTIRHYHKLGLLAEPKRTEAGYRLYSAGDLLRLQRIRQLQRLGLSLQQIRDILGQPDRERPLQEVLHKLHAEVSAQIQELEARREQIEEYLGGEAVALLEGQEEMPPTLRLLQEHLSEEGREMDLAEYRPNHGHLAQLDALLWSQPEYQSQQRELIHHMATHPDEYRAIAALMKGISVLDGKAEDAPEVEELIEELGRLREHNTILQELTALPDALGSLVDVLAEIMAGANATDLSPAQRRFFAEAARVSSRPDPASADERERSGPW
jgi:DNA-binding transcriptional MerR regulator